MPNEPHLDVLFQGISTHSWKNPGEYECRVFDCAHLPPAVSLMWGGLSKYQSAAFYETDDCMYSDTTFTFHTGSVKNRTDGYHRLAPPYMIRSMMMGRTGAVELNEKLYITKSTSSKETPKPTPDIKAKKAILGTSKVKCTVNKKKHENTTTEEAISSSYAFEWHSDEGSFGELSSNWSDPIR